MVIVSSLILLVFCDNLEGLNFISLELVDVKEGKQTIWPKFNLY